MALHHHIIGNNTYLLKISQPLSGARAGEVERKLAQLIRHGAKRVVVNLEDVTFIDGRGLAALAAGLKLLGNHADRLPLVAPQVQPSLVFELTGYNRIFYITTLAEAAPLAV